MANLTPTNFSVNDGVTTMSSREIAELCEKQHKHILRDIEKMLLDIGGSKFGPTDFQAEYTDVQNKRQREYRLPKDLTMTLITGYRADLRYKVVKRVEELEARPTALPDFTNPAEAARAWADQVETVNTQAAQIEGLSVDSDALGRIAKADGSLCMRDAAKTLQVRPIDLTRFLSTQRWIYRQSQNGPWLGYQAKITQGLLMHKVTTVDRSDGSEKIITQCRITPKVYGAAGKRHEQR